MNQQVCLLLLAFSGASLAYSVPGEYVPKSLYFIDSKGQKSDVVLIRNRRDLERTLQRFKRGGGSNTGSSTSGGSSYAFSSAGAGGGAGGGGGGAAGGGGGGINPENFGEFANFMSKLQSNFGPGSAGSFARSGSTGGAGGFGTGFSSGGNGGYGAGGNNAGHGAGGGYAGNGVGGGTGGTPGYNGPVLFSRSGESEGTGISATGQAQGPNAAFSSVSTSSQGGKVKYDVKSGQY